MTTALEVDLTTLAENLSEIAHRVSPATHMLVVKDDAYGHGLVPVVRRAWAEGVRWFGAFDVHTGVRVRDALGDDARVFVWVVGSAPEARAAVSARLDIGIGDAALLEDVAAASPSDGAEAPRVHLKIDTGLHRNGVRPEEWPAFVERAAALEREGRLRVAGIWSHLAEASDAEDDAARAVFDAAVATARASGLEPEHRHLAASAAAFARPEFRYDLVRVGAFAYGIRPAGGPSGADLRIRPIGRLTTTVVEVTPAGARIEATTLDGLPSSLSGRVSLGSPVGPCALLGIDEEGGLVTGWDGAGRGAEIVLYGPGERGESSATGLAESIGTIGEEIALRLSPLVPRRYRE